MITESERATILRVARRYGGPSVWLFGSSLTQGIQGRDIDLAVEELAPERFFDFYGELLRELARPVDLVDLSRPSRFSTIIRREGVRLG